jgi:predicted small lipoprotein YifL
VFRFILEACYEKVYLLFLALLLSFSLVGCYNKSNVNAPVDKSNAPVDYQSVVQDFLKQKNLKILINSGADAEIQLPSDFNAVKDGVRVGDLLRNRNELSKQNNLDFSNYMGQKLLMYTARIETNNDKPNYDIVLFIADNKIVGYWIDAGMKDYKQNRPDFNLLVDLLMVR